MKVKIIKEGSFTDALDQMIGSDLDGSDIDDSLITLAPKGKQPSKKPVVSRRDTRPRHQRILEDKGFQVKKELGSGMFGSVFLAIDPKGKQVAIKVLSESGIGDMAVNKEMSNYQIVQDARKKSKLVAKHFPKVFTMFSKDRFGFIVMELLTNKGAKMNLVKDIFQGREGLVPPTGDAVEIGVYKDVRRRMYTYLTNDRARNKIISKLLDGVSENIVERVKQELSSVPFLQIPAFEAGKDDELYFKILNRMNEAFLYTARDAFLDGFGELKKEYLTNPGLLVFIIKIMEILKEESMTDYYQRNVGIAMAWSDFIRKGSAIGVHNRPEMARMDRGGADPEVGDAIGEAASIRQAIEELERLTGLAGRDMHEGNIMIREYTGDIVIVDLGLFKPRSEVVEERKKKRKKRRKKRRRPRRAVAYYGMGFGHHDHSDFGGDFGGDGGGGDGKRDDNKTIKVRIVKSLEEKKKKDPVSDEISKLKDKGIKQDQAVAIALSMDERGELEEKFSKTERAKRAKKCDNPKGFTMKQFCKNQKTRSKKGERKNEELELEERCQKGYKTHPTRKTKKMFGKSYRNCVKAEEGKDPAKGTGKKPKGSGRRLYTDEDPSDTVSVSFKSVSAIQKTLSKKSFKSKSHKRQSQIINLIHQRARAAYKNAKDPKVKARLKKAYDYAKKRKEASKKKTIRMRKKKK